MEEHNTLTYNTSKRSYIYHKEGLDFQDANEHCKTNHNGTLVIADNEQTLRDLLGSYQKYKLDLKGYFRIGLKQQNGLLNWIDGNNCSDNSNLVFPANAKESCKGFAVLFQDQKLKVEPKFYAVNCSYPLPYICKKSASIETTTMSLTNSITSLNIEQDQLENTDIITAATNTNDNTVVLAVCVIAFCIVFALIVFFLARKLRKCQRVRKSNVNDLYYCSDAINNKYANAANGSNQPISASLPEYATIHEIGRQPAADPEHKHSALPPTSLQATYAVIDKNKMTHEDETNCASNEFASSLNTSLDKINSQFQTSSQYSSTNKQDGFTTSEYDCLVLNPPIACFQATYTAVDKNKIKT